MKPKWMFRRFDGMVFLFLTLGLSPLFFNNCSKSNTLEGQSLLASSSGSNTPSLISSPGQSPNSTAPAFSIDFSSGSAVAKLNGIESKIFSFIRSTSASYFGPDGVLRYANLNAPRYDYDPNKCENAAESITSNCKRKSLGLLIEETRSNKILNSIDFTGWLPAQGSVVVPPGSNAMPTDPVTILWPNVEVAPDGTTTGSRIKFRDAGANTNLSYKNLAQGKQYTFSVYVKANGFNQISLIMNSATTTIKVFDLTSQWKRLEWSFVTDGPVSDIQINNDGTVNGGAVDAFIWGAQLEEGPFATSYIPTAGTEVTRDMDRPTITDVSWLNALEGTWWVECFGQKANLAADQFVFRASSASGDNAQSIGRRATQLSSILQLNVPGQLDSSLRTPETAMIWSAENSRRVVFATYNNAKATLQESDITATVNSQFSLSGLPANFSKFSLGYNSSTNQGSMNGHIRQLNYYRRVILPSEL